MRALAGSGAGFLLAVLWFDLMFDVQVRGHSARDVAVAIAALRTVGNAVRLGQETDDAEQQSRLVHMILRSRTAGLRTGRRPDACHVPAS